MTSVYARRNGSSIHYRVVDEYGGDTLTGECERTSSKPLTLGELEDFFLGAWPLLECLDSNYDGDVMRMLGFFTGSSDFYPDFDRLLRQRVIETFAFPADDDTG